ncbi:hypothetical protein OPT61_g86 [Boeremia exigua]|uniref:Uncharacterized protein n=1 Tax=Boeremia exigua TaxID=749465 RepID=A0ACC2IV07_9PLEO|nr:hypothetical protein OPT61_g86 [Boeremia exigua]
MSHHTQRLTSLHPFVAATTIDKIYGCIIGSALGDTIGLYTEFLSKNRSEKAYPAKKFSLVEPRTDPYPDAHRLQFEPCAWTDDTDQALLILLSYLHLRTNDNDTDLAREFASRLKIWVSRGLPALNRPAYDIGILVGAVAGNQRYLTDPFQCATDRWIKSSRNAAPNGSLMRTHPIGVIGVNMTEEQTWRLSVRVGTTTHVDPRCVVACCISVGLVRQLLRGQIQTEKDMDAAIERAYDWVRQQPDIMNPSHSTDLTANQIRQHLERQEFEKHLYAETLNELHLDAQGKIGYVYKCLGAAVLLLRLAIRRTSRASIAVGVTGRAQLFEKLMVELIMEGGDADTNGAAAGALLGAYLGYANLPSHWKLGLAHNEWLMTKTERLAIVVGAAEGTLNRVDDEAADGGRKGKSLA